MYTFGSSGPYKKLYEHFGLTYINLSNLIKASGLINISYLEFNYSQSYEKSGIRSGLKVLFSDMEQIIEDNVFIKELNNACDRYNAKYNGGLRTR